MRGLCVLLAMLSLAWAQQKERCGYSAEVNVVLDTSDTNLDTEARLGATKRAILNLAQIHDFGPGRGQSKLGLCIYGEGFTDVINLNDDSQQNRDTFERLIGRNVSAGFIPLGSFNQLYEGVACAMSQFRASRRNLPQLLITIVVANDLFTQSRSAASIADAKQTVHVTSILVGPSFQDRSLLENYPTVPRSVKLVPSFQEFEIDSNRFRPNTFEAWCPIQLTPTTTTTTTTTTTIPPQPGSPCDNCVILNGIGYASTENCFSYWQCFLQPDGSWLQVRRPVAVGTFWNQNKLTGEHPAASGCRNDPCGGRTDGTLLNGYQNCRARILCLGGLSSVVDCCPLGQSFNGNDCVNDPSCVDDCNPQDTTPNQCYLSSDDTDRRGFIVRDGDFSQNMRCAIGTFYQNVICGCDHDDEPFDPRICTEEPEVDLAFGPDGQVRDRSRNQYYITTENFATQERSDAAGLYAGLFTGNTTVRIQTANFGTAEGLTIKVVYQTTRPTSNAAVLTDAECIGTRRTLSILDNPSGPQAFIRTIPNNDVLLDGARTPGADQTVTLQYDRASLMLSAGGRVQTTAAGPLFFQARACDGIKLGNGKDVSGFTGIIKSVKIFKCIGNGIEDFDNV